MIKVKKRKILLMPGDEVGPEVVAEVKKIIQWLNSKKSLDFLSSSLSFLNASDDLVLIAEDLKEAQKHLGFITRPLTSDELLGHIFSEFCIGK